MARTKTTGLAAFTNRGSALAAPDEAPPAAAVATSRAPAHAPAAAGRARGQVAPAGRKRGQGATVAPACAWRAPIGGAAASARRRREPAGNQSCAGCRRCSHPKACQASAHDVLTSSRQNLQSAAVSFSRAAAAGFARSSARIFSSFSATSALTNATRSTASGSTWPLSRAMRPHGGEVLARGKADCAS